MQSPSPLNQRLCALPSYSGPVPRRHTCVPGRPAVRAPPSVSGGRAAPGLSPSVPVMSAPWTPHSGRRAHFSRVITSWKRMGSTECGPNRRGGADGELGTYSMLHHTERLLFSITAASTRFSLEWLAADAVRTKGYCARRSGVERRRGCVCVSRASAAAILGERRALGRSNPGTKPAIAGDAARERHSLGRRATPAGAAARRSARAVRGLGSGRGAPCAWHGAAVRPTGDGSRADQHRWRHRPAGGRWWWSKDCNKQ